MITYEVQSFIYFDFQIIYRTEMSSNIEKAGQLEIFHIY